jgi:hypothetical protein
VPTGLTTCQWQDMLACTDACVLHLLLSQAVSNLQARLANNPLPHGSGFDEREGQYPSRSKPSPSPHPCLHTWAIVISRRATISSVGLCQSSSSTWLRSDLSFCRARAWIADSHQCNSLKSHPVDAPETAAKSCNPPPVMQAK